jgi:hypothetical protein
MNAPHLGLAVLIALAAASAAGCAKSCTTARANEQTFDEGMRLICQSRNEEEIRARIEATDSFEEKLTIACMWLSQHLNNEEAGRLLMGLAPLPPREKARTVREAAARTGLSECPLADLWELGARQDEAARQRKALAK